MKQKDIWDKLYATNLMWKRESISLPKVLKDKKVLELGVGTGKTLLSIIKQKPREVIAIDNSSIALSKIPLNIKNNVKLLNCDAKSLPFPDNYFDVVICYYLLNNSLVKDRELIVKEIHRILKPKGIILFEDFSINDFRNQGKSHSKDKNTIVKKNTLFCHFFTEKEIKSLFSNFSKLKINILSSNPFRSKPKIKRQIIKAAIIK